MHRIENWVLLSNNHISKCYYIRISPHITLTAHMTNEFSLICLKSIQNLCWSDKFFSDALHQVKNLLSDIKPEREIKHKKCWNRRIKERNRQQLQQKRRFQWMETEKWYSLFLRFRLHLFLSHLLFFSLNLTQYFIPFKNNNSWAAVTLLI